MFTEGGNTQNDQKETQIISFHVAEYGLEMYLDEVLTSEEFYGRDPEAFEPNRHWYEVRVASEADKQKWLELKNEWLGCMYQSNQTSEERVISGARIDEINAELKSLEK